MHAAIADKREDLAELCRRHGVARLEVFGSAARGADFEPETSDADFLVEFNRDSGLAPFDQYFELAEALRDTLGRPVDLVESGTVHNPYFRAAIDRSRELVYAC
ncbi:nucleotidyltransferase family protein [Candidatus Rariloculus sp.]|uniref:nucleotidyltransferase family protein n=1 Tax=Candidatus Rariloculus sp. TaxID=3101265 RepID=UPI003D13955C